MQPMTTEQVTGLVMYLINNVNVEHATTRKVLAALPEEQTGFKLGEKGRTAQELAWHIITTDVWILNSIANLSFAPGEKPEMPGTVAGMVAWYEAEFPKALGRVSAMTPEQIATPISFHGVLTQPAGLFLGLLTAHQIHHRGQLSTYLRAMNAHVPAIYGGSADEPFQASAQA